MTKNFKIAVIIIILLVTGAGAYSIYRYTANPVKTSSNGVNTPKKSDVLTRTYLPSDLTLSYTHPSLGFTFKYPEGFKIGDLPDDTGETILVQNNGQGFQIYTRPLEQQVEITADLVKSDLPDMVVENPFQIDISGTRALVFDSKNDSGEKTGEIWFWNNGTLYQISTPQEFAKTLAEIIKTWQWQ
jgi:hypothetical protein